MYNGVTVEIVREFFDYDPDTGVLFWRWRDREWFATDANWKNANTKCAGKPAGTLCTRKGSGYSWIQIHIPIDNTRKHSYFVHRIIWMWVTGEHPPEQVDHINRDATDNRWVNLRESNSTENNKNKSMNSRNTSGYTGVSWHKKRKSWVATIRTRNQMYNLGSYVNKQDAIDARKKAELDHGFYEGHGENKLENWSNNG